MFRRISLRLRIFVSMILLVLVAFGLIAGVTIIQYQTEVDEYHRDRLERKEDAVREHINYVLRTTSFDIERVDNLPVIFREKIFEIANIHNLQINLYDLQGHLLKSSKENFGGDSLDISVPDSLLLNLRNSANKRFVVKKLDGNKIFQSSYSYINDAKFKPLMILNIPYLQEEDFIRREHIEFLSRLGQVYFLMLLIAIAFSYFISRYITQSLKVVSEKMTRMRLGGRNQKITVRQAGEEIQNLVTAYNSMVDQLEDSATKLAAGERENAWREMAKQVAHEIKNPLTPMRLSVQSFENRFDPNAPDATQKLEDFCKSLIQQIDTLSSIASAFSNFSDMPAQNAEEINVTEAVRLALDIFDEKYIMYSASKENIYACFDRSQLIRIVTNLVKNGIQAVSVDKTPRILVQVDTSPSDFTLTVSDNGVGIQPEDAERIFQPQFTTKSSGMGLGLAIVKNIVENNKGRISFSSKPGKGTVFTVRIPRKQAET